MYIHIHIHTYIHAYTHTHTYTCSRVRSRGSGSGYGEIRHLCRILNSTANQKCPLTLTQRYSIPTYKLNIFTIELIS